MNDKPNTKDTEMVPGQGMVVRDYREVEYVLENEEGLVWVVRRYSGDGVKYYLYPNNDRRKSFCKEEEDPRDRFYADGYTLRGYRSVTVLEKKFQTPLGI